MNIDICSNVLYLNIQEKEKKQIKIEINNTFQQKLICYSTVTKYIREDFFTSQKTIYEKEHKNFEHLYFQELILKVYQDYRFYSTIAISEMNNIPKTTVYSMLTNELHFVSSHLNWSSIF